MRSISIPIPKRRRSGFFVLLGGLLALAAALGPNAAGRQPETVADPGSGPTDGIRDGTVRAAGNRSDGGVEIGGSAMTSQPALLPAALLQLPPTIEAAVVIDLTGNRMYVYEHRAPALRLIADLYVSIGKNGSRKLREGDEKTPVGIYFVTDFIPDERLPELYGAGAFPVDYPNLWDRRQGRTGSGIWIHGLPDSEVNRPPRASRGCLTLSNQDFLAIAPAIEPGRTPVVLTEEVRWLAPPALSDLREEILRAQESWRDAWQRLDTETYLSFYAPDFRSEGMDYTAWSRHKRRVNANKSFIRVELDQVGLYRYPGEPDLVLVDYHQTYRSSNFQQVSRKRQLWQRREGRWQIVQEGRV